VRILIHDYVGHPFQVQLSRQLAKRGHEVRHAYCGSIHTPQGSFARRADDPESFGVDCIDLGARIPKTGYLRRFRMEAEYGRKLVALCSRFQPEVVLSGNTPSIPQHRLTRYCKQQGIRHIFWVQDIYGIAVYNLLKRRIPGVGHLVGKYFMSLDRTSARLSDAIVVITKDFLPIFRQWGVEESRMHVVENWAVLEELSVRPRDNAWSQEQNFASGPRFIYTGTLAMKHNPALLLALAKTLEARGEGQLLVVSEGSGVEWLRREADAQGIRTIRYAGFQPFEQLAEVLGSADVLVAILEPEAGVFSVPSKVLSYMCAGRALLAAMPLENLAARLIVKHQAGRVVTPDDYAGFCAAATELMDSEEQRKACGRAARQYAEKNFDIDRVTDQFEKAMNLGP